MKTLGLILLLASAPIFLGGCNALPLPNKTSDWAPINIINQAFDSFLHRKFTGTVDFYHTNPYLRQTFHIRGGGIKYVEGFGWTWKWLEYRREGISSGYIRLGLPPWETEREDV